MQESVFGMFSISKDSKRYIIPIHHKPMQSRTIILLVSRDLSHPDSFPAIPTFLAPVQVCGDETSEDKEAGKPGGGRAERVLN